MDDKKFYEQLANATEDNGHELTHEQLVDCVAEQRAIASLLSGLQSEDTDPGPDFAVSVMTRLYAEQEPWFVRFWRFWVQPRPIALHWRPITAVGILLLVGLVGAGVLLGVQSTSDNEAGVRFVFVASNAKSVAVAGDFNNWDTASHRLKQMAPGVWTVTVPLEPGRYEYMYVVNGNNWVTDPRARTFRPDGFGRTNAVLEL